MKKHLYLWALLWLSCMAFLYARLSTSADAQPQSTDFAADMQHIGNEKIFEVIILEQTKSPALKKSDYTVKNFKLSQVKGLSTKQINEHLSLYAGYVTKWNQIEDALQTVSRESISPTYCPFRALKVGETYAMNGTILHELYFENLGHPGSAPLAQTKKLLEKNFGSVANYLQDLKDCGMAARGWVLTAYSLFDGSVRNYVLDSHNDHVPVMVIPLVVLDVYEHAYMIEFGIKRALYLNVFVDNINWSVIENRVKKWAH
ncbi:MAG: Fe-Mn family superoxide dismutase [Candidatus Babeliales bacterium]